LKRRALHGVRLLLEGRVDHLIACGGVGTHPPSEAEVIRSISLEQGVSSDNITLEDRSRNTRENLAFALPILKHLGNPPVIIVTDGYHAPRALMIARRLGITATASCPAPSGTGRLSRLKSTLREIPAYAADRVRPIAKP
jgi:uncharacterized SAM-binding protein YcdF (DUF218 family)